MKPKNKAQKDLKGKKAFQIVYQKDVINLEVTKKT